MKPHSLVLLAALVVVACQPAAAASVSSSMQVGITIRDACHIRSSVQRADVSRERRRAFRPTVACTSDQAFAIRPPTQAPMKAVSSPIPRPAPISVQRRDADVWTIEF